MRLFPGCGIASLIFLCSCATPEAIRPNLPADARMNTEAGRGDHLFVKLHLEGGEDLIFAVDTGFPVTVLDQSLELQLGKSIGTQRFRYGWIDRGFSRFKKYQSPKLYLGQTQLALGDHVLTDDLQLLFQNFQKQSISGILGMDCLRHYCVQLDFAARTIHFPDSNQLDSQNLGRAFPLTIFFGSPSTRADFCGVKNVRFHLDTGDYSDGALKPNFLKQALNGQKDDRKFYSTNGLEIARRLADLPQISFGGETYTNLTMKDSTFGISPGGNLIGLRFLARHLVTFDFPKRIMYLKPNSAGPLAPADNSTNSLTYKLVIEASKFLQTLKKQGQLPGWNKDETGWVTPEPQAPVFELTAEGKPEIYPFTLTVTRTDKKSKSLGYHYTAARADPDAPWQLKRAWRTNPAGQMVEEYALP